MVDNVWKPWRREGRGEQNLHGHLGSRRWGVQGKSSRAGFWLWACSSDSGTGLSRKETSYGTIYLAGTKGLLFAEFRPCCGFAPFSLFLPHPSPNEEIPRRTLSSIPEPLTCVLRPSMSETSPCWSLTSPSLLHADWAHVVPMLSQAPGKKPFLYLEAVLKSVFLRLNPSSSLTFLKGYFRLCSSLLDFSQVALRQMWSNQLWFQKENMCVKIIALPNVWQ